MTDEAVLVPLNWIERLVALSKEARAERHSWDLYDYHIPCEHTSALIDFSETARILIPGQNG